MTIRVMHFATANGGRTHGKERDKAQTDTQACSESLKDGKNDPRLREPKFIGNHSQSIPHGMLGGLVSGNADIAWSISRFMHNRQCMIRWRPVLERRIGLCASSELARFIVRESGSVAIRTIPPEFQFWVNGYEAICAELSAPAACK